MPLLPGKKNIGRNIKEMENSGHSHDQSVAAALNKAGVSKKNKKKNKKKLKELLQTEAKKPSATEKSKITVGDKKYQKTMAFGNRNVQQIQRNKKKYHRPSQKNSHNESFDTLINKYLTDYLFSEDAMAPAVANPNAPASPAEQKKIQDAKKKKALQLAKPGVVTQAQADAYELGKSEKL